MKRSLIRYGTYGFMSMLLAAQLAMADSTPSDEADRALVDAKKTARAVRRDAKKAVRKLESKGSLVEDVKDEAGDAVENTKDEVNHLKKKMNK